MLITSALLLSVGENLFVFLLICSALACIIFIIKRLPFASHSLLFTGALVLSALITCNSHGTMLSEYALAGENRVVTGTVFSVPETDENGFSSYIIRDCNVNGEAIRGKISVCSKEKDSIFPGNTVTIQVQKLQANTSKDIFSAHRMSEGVSLFAISSEPAEITGTTDKHTASLKLLSLREKINDKLSYTMSEDTAGVAGALITGEKSSLSEETVTDMRICGASHIFAVSGMHLTLWTGIFFVLFRQRSKSAFIPNLAALAFVIFYCILTGLSPSVLRAGIMLSAVFIARLLRRQADAQNSLGIAVSVLLCINPFLSGNISFLLSSAATFALVSFVPAIFENKKTVSGRMKHLRQKLKVLPDSIRISFAVILITLPLCSVFFGYFSLLSPVSSLVITLPAELLMILSGLALIFPAGSLPATALFYLSEYLGKFIIDCASFLAEFTTAVMPADKNIIIPLFTTATIVTSLLIMLRKSKKQALATVLAFTLIHTGITAFSFAYHKREAVIHIPGGENATCFSLLSGNGTKSAVFGCGGSYEYFSKNTAFLNSKGILRTDFVFIPRSKATENANSKYLSAKLQPESIISHTESTKALRIEGTLWENTEIISDTTEDFAASRLTVDGTEIVICTLPCSDISYKENPEYSTADILISRSSLPKNIDTEDFSDIIIITDRHIPSLPDNAITTKDSDITITLKGDSYVISR